MHFRQLFVSNALQHNPRFRICDVEIPNGLPLIYDVNSRCIKLLDDGSGRDLTKAYNFGSAVDLLFRPCLGEDGEEEEEECDLVYEWPSIRIPIPKEGKGGQEMEVAFERELNEVGLE